MSDIVYKNFTFSTPFLSGYRELKIPIVNGAGCPAWPEKFPISVIDELQTTVGPRHFAAQMMLTPIAPERTRLDPGWLHIYDTVFDMRTARIGDAVMTGAALYWDPASGRRKSDGSVCVLIYRDDKNRHIYLHDILYLRVSDNDLYPLARQCDSVLDFMAAYDMRRLVVETNGIGGGLPEIMRDVAHRRGCPITVQGISNSKNKETRILDAIEPVLSTGRLHAHERIRASPLLAEMIGWTPVGGAGHDDGLDALAGAIAINPVPIRPHGTAIGTFCANTNFEI